MRAALAVAVVLAVVGACSGSRPAVGAEAGAIPVALDAGVADAGVFDAAADAAIDAHRVADDALIGVLAREAAGPVMLVERGGAIVAVTVGGETVRVLAAKPVRRVQYDRAHVLWFLRGSQLVAIDLEQAAPAEIVVADRMPDLHVLVSSSTSLDQEYCPEGCTAIRISVSAAIAVVPGETGVRAAPRLTDEGRALLAALAGRPGVPFRLEALGTDRWPLPPAERKRPSCAYDTCGRGYALTGLPRVLLVVGRSCDCRVGACRALCLWFQPDAKRYASLREPTRWLTDATGEPGCHPELDAGGTAYVLGGDISPGPLVACTAAGCRREPGRFVGWLEPGSSTEALMEDLSTCPE